MAELTVRKIGNSLGSIFPKRLGLHNGDKLPYERKGNKLIIDLNNSDIKHDRQLIEESFDDFKNGKWVDEKVMEKEFGKYGWGKE